MSRLKKNLIVVGDRLLIRPEEGEERKVQRILGGGTSVFQEDPWQA